MRNWIPAIVVAAASYAGAAAGSALPPIEAEPCVREVQFEPAAARVMQPLTSYDFSMRVRVERHADHRLLVLEWDSDLGQGRSIRELEGDESAVTHRFAFRGLPGAKWAFKATVFDSTGKAVGSGEAQTLFVEEPRDGGEEETEDEGSLHSRAVQVSQQD